MVLLKIIKKPLRDLTYLNLPLLINEIVINWN